MHPRSRESIPRCAAGSSTRSPVRSASSRHPRPPAHPRPLHRTCQPRQTIKADITRFRWLRPAVCGHRFFLHSRLSTIFFQPRSKPLCSGSHTTAWYCVYSTGQSRINRTLLYTVSAMAVADRLSHLTIRSHRVMVAAQVSGCRCRISSFRKRGGLITRSRCCLPVSTHRLDDTRFSRCWRHPSKANRQRASRKRE